MAQIGATNTTPTKEPVVPKVMASEVNQHHIEAEHDGSQ